MDSESAAQASAQQKHHKHMMFGKKQRYIEVFQCSGEDMNMVLNGGYNQFQSPPAISAKPLTSGMLPSTRQSSTVQPLQVSIPPPLSIPLSISQQAILPSATNTNHAMNVNAATNANQTQSSLIAQQQQQTAHFIAQQNLMARQQAAAAAAQLQAAQHSADQMAFFQNFNFLSSPTATSSSLAAAASSSSAGMNTNPYAFQLGPHMPQLFYFPRPMLPMGLMPTLNTAGHMPYAGQFQSNYVNPSQQLSNVSAGALNPNQASGAPQTTTTLATTSVKRSYENAFRNDPMTVTAAKRAYHPNQPHPANIYGTYPYPQM